MTSQQLEERSRHLELRVEALETELAQLRPLLAHFLQTPTPWWITIAGSFEHDSTFEAATHYGQAWRQTAE